MSRDDHDIIGTKPVAPPLDLGPLFTQPTVEEATKELQQFTHTEPADPAPAPRAREETQAFAHEAMTERQRQDRITQIQRAVLTPLLDLALLRKDLPHDRKPGVTAEDARRIAAEKQLSGLLGDQQRAWSWLSGWLQQVARDGQLVKYMISGITVKRMADNGNDQVVYLHPYDYRAREAA